MNELAVCVVNYNKKKFIMECIDSTLESTFKAFDFYFVDNGSTDGSVEAVKQRYGDKIQYLLNKTNSGSSGGFNTASKMAVEKGYKYVILLDHDVVLDNDAIKNLVAFADDNDDVAVVGGKMLWYDNPGIVQIYGTGLDFKKFSLVNKYKNYLNNDDIPKFEECHFVPAGISLVKTAAIKKVGFMDESYFTYWDDADWYFRFIKAGYKIMVISSAFVFHHFGTSINTTTFPTYSYWRNRIRFFAKYLSDDELPKFCDAYLKELFQALYSCAYSNKINSIKTLVRAYDDAINGVYGNAYGDIYLERDKIDNRSCIIFEKQKNIVIIFNGNFKILRNVYNKILQISPNCNISFVYDGDSLELLKRQYEKHMVYVDIKQASKDSFFLALCSHIFEVETFTTGVVYVDEYLNFVVDDKDRTYCHNYARSFDFFYKINFFMFLDKLKKIRDKGFNDGIS